MLAIVFGSFIELNEFRDIDLAVYILDRSPRRLDSLWAKIEGVLKIPIDLVPISEISPSFRLRILTKGKIVLEKRPGLYEALLINTLDEARANKSN